MAVFRVALAASLLVAATAAYSWDKATGLCVAKYDNVESTNVVMEPADCTHVDWESTFKDVSTISSKEKKAALSAVPATVVHLDLSSHKLNQDDVLDEVVAIVKAAKDLKYLNLFKNHFGDEMMKAIAKIWGSSETLEVIDFGRNCCGRAAWSFQSLIEISKALKRNKHLKELHLDGMPTINDESIQALTEAVAGHPTLETLSLEWNSIGGWAGKHFAKLVKGSKSLKQLLLQGNHLSSGYTDIGAGLQHNSALESLRINGVDDNGARAIAAGINHAKKPYSKLIDVRVLSSPELSQEASGELFAATSRNRLSETEQDKYYAEQAKIAAKKRKLKEEKKKADKKKDGKALADPNAEDKNDDEEDSQWTVSAIDHDEL